MPHLPRSNGWLLVLGALVVGAAVVPATTVRARSLGFEDRVGAQREIERVYYSHQLGARRSFEEAVRQDILEAKVRTYLRETVALRTFWGVTGTGRDGSSRPACSIDGWHACRRVTTRSDRWRRSATASSFARSSAGHRTSWRSRASRSRRRRGTPGGRR